MWGNCLYQFDFEDYLRWKHKKWELKGEETSMKKEVMVDMTSGRIAPQILKFAMPVLLGLIFQRIYNFADSYIVGHFLGDNALAAVSVAGVGMYLMFSLIIGLTTGVTVVMSQYYGAKEEDKVVKTFFSSIYIALGMTIIVTVVGLIVTKPLLLVLQTPEEVLDQAVLYLRLICAGCIGTMLYNWISAVLRSLGNSVVPLVFLGISSLLNIVFDVLFVAVLPMGVGGAAFATVLAQIVSGVACLLYAWKILPMLRIRREKTEAGYLYRKTDAGVWSAGGFADEYYFHFRYDVTGSGKYIRNDAGGGLRCLRQSGRTWYAGGGCIGNCTWNLYRTEYRSEKYSAN